MELMDSFIGYFKWGNYKIFINIYMNVSKRSKSNKAVNIEYKILKML